VFSKHLICYAAHLTLNSLYSTDFCFDLPTHKPTKVVNALRFSYVFDIPYTAKLLRGRTFAVFAVFQQIAKVFPLNQLLCTVHDYHSLMHCENFPVNSVICTQPQKFSPSKVLLYAVMVFIFVYIYRRLQVRI